MTSIVVIFSPDFEGPCFFLPLAPAAEGWGGGGEQGSVSNEREEPAGFGNQEGFSTVSVILPFTAETFLLPRWHYPPPRVRSYRWSVSTEIAQVLEAHTSLYRRSRYLMVRVKSPITQLPRRVYACTNTHRARRVCIV